MLKKYENKMMNSADEIFHDKTLRCVEQDCQEMFTWSADEQQWFKENKLTYPPARCLDCRRKRRLEKMKNGMH